MTDSLLKDSVAKVISIWEKERYEHAFSVEMHDALTDLGVASGLRLITEFGRSVAPQRRST